VECKILKIDIEGRNIVISRRKLIEEERRASKEKVLEEIEVGQLRKGVVKNIADFGVFVDLGGVDGLLHISDLSWGRISHPSEVVELDQEIECIVIGFDRKNEKISLGLKQKTPSPWETVEERYPVGARVRGKVVNVMNYGVFVRLEDGVEGLVHISEMSWTRRLAHPGEMVNLGDEIEIVVLNLNKERQEISLGLKQTETNPWTIAAQKYPPGTVVDAKVRSMTNFGAFVEIEPGIDGMIHISDLSWTRKYGHPSEALQKGQQIKCVVLEVNEERHRVSLGIKQMNEDPWIRAIPEKYIPGHIIKGKIAKLTNFGAFVELEPDLEGLLHISELADHKIEKPQDVVKPSEEVEVKILKVDPDSRKIGLSLRRVKWAAEEQATEPAQRKTPPDQAAPARADLAEPAKPQEEPGEADEKAAADQPAPADVDEAPKVEEEPGQSEKKTPADDATPADASVGEAAKPEEESGEAEQTEPSEPEAQQSKAGEGEATSVAKQQVTDQAEQADFKQPQDSADADSQASGDDAEGEKAEEGA
jgi:small subunit ribosomal protein S1